MRVYASCFYKNHLILHFKIEEEHIFPILGNNNKLGTRALTEHRRLHRLFAETDNDALTLNKVEDELKQHIRFEERKLFPEIQKVASEKQMLEVEKIHQPEIF